MKESAKNLLGISEVTNPFDTFASLSAMLRRFFPATRLDHELY